MHIPEMDSAWDKVGVGCRAMGDNVSVEEAGKIKKLWVQSMRQIIYVDQWFFTGGLWALGDIWSVQGNVPKVSLPPHFSFLDITMSWGTTSIWRKARWWTYCRGRSASLKMPIAPSALTEKHWGENEARSDCPQWRWGAWPGGWQTTAIKRNIERV